LEKNTIVGYGVDAKEVLVDVHENTLLIRKKSMRVCMT